MVLGETPSLASSLAGLLEVEGIPVLMRPSLARAGRTRRGEPASQLPVLVSTSTRHSPDLLREWREGPFRESDLILVGARDPDLRSEGRLHVARLPLVPDEFLALVRKLIAKADRVPRWAGASAA
jgi:hypothetical protein